MNTVILFQVFLLLQAEYTAANPYLNFTVLETRPWPKQMIGGNFTITTKIENGNGFNDIITWSKGDKNVGRLEILTNGSVQYVQGIPPTGSPVHFARNFTTNAKAGSSVTYFTMTVVGIRESENGTVVQIFRKKEQYVQLRLNVQKYLGDPYLNLTVVETSPWPKQVIGGNFTITTRIENGNGFNDIITWSKGGKNVGRLKILTNGSVQYAQGIPLTGSPVQFYWHTTRYFGSSVTYLTMKIVGIRENENRTLVGIFRYTQQYVQLRLNIQNCPSKINEDLSVIAASNSYGSLGQYQCKNNGTLHRSDVHQLVTSNKTTCTNSAEWEGQEYMTCWKAPSVFLIGSNSHKANEIASFSCEYANGVFPPVTLVRFAIHSKAIESKERNISTEMTRELNGKTVTCQAISNYTLLHPDAGRSNSILLNISYPPYTNASQNACDFASGNVENCSIEFYANPSPIKVVLFQPGKNTSKDVTTKVTSQGERNTLVLPKTNFMDNGIYIINISSAIYDTSIQFHVTIATTTTVATNPVSVVPNKSTVLPVAVGAAVASILLLSGAAFLFYWFKVKRPRDETEQDFSPSFQPTKTMDETNIQPSKVEKSEDLVDLNTDVNGYLTFAPVEEKNRGNVYESIRNEGNAKAAAENLYENS